MDHDDDEHIGADIPMSVFELVSAVPDDAADDKKQNNHISCFWAKERREIMKDNNF